MKKLLGILTAAALLFSAVSCAQDDGVMTMDEAYDGAGSTAELVTNVANFTLKTSDGTAVTELELAKGGSTTLTSSLKGIEARATIGGYVNVTVSDTTVTITGRSAGTDYIIFTYSGMDCGYLKVTVTPKETYQVSFTGLATDPVDLTATISNSSYITSATSLAHTVTSKFGTENTSTTGYDSSIIGGSAGGYKVVGNKDNLAIAADDEIGTFSTTVTAKTALKMDSISFTIGSTSFAVYGKYDITVADGTTELSSASTSGKSSTGTFDVSSDDLTLEAGAEATITLHVYAGNTKGAAKGINFGISSLVIAATAAE